MGNKMGNGANGNYMENMDYKTKNIEKLEDLKDHKWGFRNAYFQLMYDKAGKYLCLIQTNGKNLYGEYPVNNELKYINLKNLTELEFYGLKVILNEKPKLNKKDREFLEKEIYFARDKNDNLFVHFLKPVRHEEAEMWSDCDCTMINYELFPFITWESGKAWSKAELMELEVVE